MINLNRFGATVVLIAIIFLGLVILALPGEVSPTRATPLEVVLQPEAATEMEAQRLAAQTEQLKVEAEAELAQRRETTRQMIIVAVLLGAIWALSTTAIVLYRLAHQPKTITLLPRSPEFDYYLEMDGGQYINGQPFIEGKPVKRLEVER